VKKNKKTICTGSMGVVYLRKFEGAVARERKPQTKDNMTTTDYSHANITETSRIWPSAYRNGEFKWANRAGEGECDTFEAAAREAEEALIFSDIQCELIGEQFEVVRDVFFASHEGRETIEVCLWNGFSLADVSGQVHNLEILLEGGDEWGRVYTLAVRA
jgi:hypothetical protein